MSVCKEEEGAFIPIRSSCVYTVHVLVLVQNACSVRSVQTLRQYQVIHSVCTNPFCEMVCRFFFALHRVLLTFGS